MDDYYPDNSRHQASYNKTEAPPQSQMSGVFVDATMTDLPQQQSERRLLFPFLKKAPKGLVDAVNFGVDSIILPAVNDVARRFLYSFVDYFCDQVFHTNYGYRHTYDPRYPGRPTDYSRYSRERYRESYRDPDDSMYYYEGSYRTNRNQHFALHTIGFMTKEAAWKCIKDMQQEIRLRGTVSVDYFYNYVGKPCPSRQGWRWGWRTLEDAVPVPTNRGFRIQFPELMPID